MKDLFFGTEPDVITIKKLTEALNITLDDLFDF